MHAASRRPACSAALMRHTFWLCLGDRAGHACGYHLAPALLAHPTPSLACMPALLLLSSLHLPHGQTPPCVCIPLHTTTLIVAASLCACSRCRAHVYGIVSALSPGLAVPPSTSCHRTPLSSHHTCLFAHASIIIHMPPSLLASCRRQSMPPCEPPCRVYWLALPSCMNPLASSPGDWTWLRILSPCTHTYPRWPATHECIDDTIATEEMGCTEETNAAAGTPLSQHIRRVAALLTTDTSHFLQPHISSSFSQAPRATAPPRTYHGLRSRLPAHVLPHAWRGSPSSCKPPPIFISCVCPPTPTTFHLQAYHCILSHVQP
ncbi:hypothetical protein EVG20_g8767 [Dentipellis fragilis]|uniref:Uncharacterized protein n=1 Tax=Dentipellis fragilis TaxID=205917 RepID=A0A4Y9Y4K1_9AGAM|nr:hypothetical protein EVG20_g8767 [Dentipellis fragilis]